MLATLVSEPFDDKDWVYETKWDGFRLITEKRGDTVRLWSRNGIDVTSRYAMLLSGLKKIDGSCVIDGELCALDAHGRSRFQLLQNALNEKATLLYVVFDALFVDGKKAATLRGPRIAEEFQQMVVDYIETHYRKARDAA